MVKEKADEIARAAAESSASQDEIPGDYHWETSMAHTIRVATEVKTGGTCGLASSHIRAGRRYRSSPV